MYLAAPAVGPRRAGGFSKTCGTDMCQRYYPIPFDLLKADGNVLTLLDEMGPVDLSAVQLAVSENKRIV